MTTKPSKPATRDVVFRIRRFDPAAAGGPQEQDYVVPVPAGMVVLEALWYVKEHLDPTLAWRASCRMGVCGSCGMLIDGRPTLACNTQVRDVTRDGVVRLAPLPNFEVVRDLVSVPVARRKQEQGIVVTQLGCVAEGVEQGR